jgi:hypothetical protein
MNIQIFDPDGEAVCSEGLGHFHIERLGDGALTLRVDPLDDDDDALVINIGLDVLNGIPRISMTMEKE